MLLKPKCTRSKYCFLLDNAWRKWTQGFKIYMLFWKGRTWAVTRIQILSATLDNCLRISGLNRTCIYMLLKPNHKKQMHCYLLDNAKESWRTAKCTRRLLYVMKKLAQETNIDMFFLIMPKKVKLSFGHKFICHTWKLLKLCTTETCISVFLHTVL